MTLIENKTKKYMKYLVLLVSYVIENLWTKKVLKVKVIYRMINAENHFRIFSDTIHTMGAGEKSFFFIYDTPISYLTSDSLHSAQHTIYSFNKYFTPWCLPDVMTD